MVAKLCQLISAWEQDLTLIWINSLDMAYQTILIPSSLDDITNMVPASHQQNFWGRIKKKFAQGRKTSDFRKGLQQKQKRSDSVSSREDDFLPQHAETCANEVQGSGKICEEFKWKGGNEAPASVVGFLWVVVTSLVGWEMHLRERGD